MDKNDSKHIPNVDLSEYLFEEIASSAAEVNELCSYIDYEGDADSLGIQIRVMRKLVNRIGWMADLGCKKLTGAESVQGDAERWLMHPAYTKALQSGEV